MSKATLNITKPSALTMRTILACYHSQNSNEHGWTNYESVN
uniref:Uncharacterized protein n=1 Tax=Anguilla anguilla TaxID=7936 RepID=A0A0E9VDI5_ANGAN